MNKPKNKTELDFMANDLADSSTSLNALTNSQSLLSRSILGANVINSAISLQNTFEAFNKSQALLPKFDNNLSYLAGSTASALLSLSSNIESIGFGRLLSKSNLQTSVISSAIGLQSSFEAMSKYQASLPKFNNNLSYLAGSTAELLSSSANIKSINSSGINNLATYANILTDSTAIAANFSKLVNPDFSMISANKALLGLSEQVSYAKTLKYAVYAEKSILGITSENFGSKISIEQINKNHIRNTFSTLTGSYSTIMKSIENPILYRQLDSTVAKLTPIEYFSTANLLESISVDEKTTIDEEVLKSEIIYENEISLIEHLPKFDTGLYNMWKGAIETLNSQNSDRIRHFITSIRELFTHLFQRLAPDKDVKTWTNDPAHFFNNRPTRKTRLLYIFRNINDKLFADFLQKDIETTIALIDVFQKGTHSINSSFTEYQLIAIKSKSESTLKFLLELHFKINP